MAMKIMNVTEIEGFRLGNAENSEKGTGCTVIICEEGAVGGVDVRGGGPATRETDLLRSENTVNSVNAVVLSGGSAFGLEAASGVMRELAEKKIGFDVGDGIVVPIVCGASLYDLPVGDPKAFPDIYMGAQSVRNAFEGHFANGNHGAGTGATVGKLKGYDRAMKTGLGTFACGDGIVEVGAIAAVNAVGDIYNGAGNIIAGLRSDDGKTIYGTIKTMKSMVHDKIKLIDESTLFINRSDLEEALSAAAKQYEEEVQAEEPQPYEEPVEEAAAEMPAEEVTEAPEEVYEEPEQSEESEEVYEEPVQMDEPVEEAAKEETAEYHREFAEISLPVTSVETDHIDGSEVSEDPEQAEEPEEVYDEPDQAEESAEVFDEPEQAEEPAEVYEESRELFDEQIEEAVLAEEAVQELAEEAGEELAKEEEPVVLTREEMGYDIVFNTTISCIITNADLTKSQANKLASILHDAYARAIKPVHGTLDGDTVFVLATGKQKVNFDAFAALATDVMQYAIIDGAMSAESAYGLPAARDMQ